MTAGSERLAVGSKNQRKTMTRSIFISICLLPTVLLLTVLVADAQQAKKVPRIGYLSVLSPSSDSSRIEAFRHGLRELGYVEGQTFAIESRYAEGKLDRLPELAGELVRLKLDVVVVGGSTAIRAIRNATKLIPSSWRMGAIPLRSGMWQAWRGRGETSRG